MGWFGLNRGVAQLASVPRLGRGGREFESHHPDMSNLKFRILVYLLLGTGVLAAGLVINRPNSGQLEAIEAASNDQAAPPVLSAQNPDQASYSVVLTSRSTNRTFGVEVAKTVEEQSAGLADRDGLEENRGMLFVFDRSSEPSFWMRGMRFSLDIIWIANGKIIQIDRNLLPPRPGQSTGSLPLYRPPSPIDYVLEIKGGLASDFSLGDSATISVGQAK